MKENVKMSRVVGYLEKMYRELNNDFFGGELEEPIITIQDTPNVYGHISVKKIWTVKDTTRYELNIGAGTLNRPIEDIVATLLHEMVHIYNLMHDIKDTSRNNTYHNKKFKTKAEEVGLIIGHHYKIGYSVTSPSDSLILYIAEKPWENILINRNIKLHIGDFDNAPDNDNHSHSTNGKKRSSTRKYICPACGISVRATKKVSIMCVDCQELMVVAQ